MLTRLLKDIAVESKLLPIIKYVSLSKIQKFCVMSQAAGPIHVDKEYCAKTPFKKPLVPGFMLSGYVAELMENNFGNDWFTTGEMEISFIQPARSGDTILVEGTIKEKDGNKIIVDIKVTNQKNSLVAKGFCQVVLS